MSKVKSDLVEAFVFYRRGNRKRILLLKRRAGSHWGGLWQGISGRIKKGESAIRACLREIGEETNLRVKRLYALDLVNQFYAPRVDAVYLGPFFAAEVTGPASLRLSQEHDSHRWVTVKEALRLVNWEGYCRALERVQKDLFSRNTVNPHFLVGEIPKRKKLDRRRKFHI